MTKLSLISTKPKSILSPNSASKWLFCTDYYHLKCVHNLPEEDSTDYLLLDKISKRGLRDSLKEQLSLYGEVKDYRIKVPIVIHDVCSGLLDLEVIVDDIPYLVTLKLGDTCTPASLDPELLIYAYAYRGRQPRVATYCNGILEVGAVDDNRVNDVMNRLQHILCFEQYKDSSPDICRKCEYRTRYCPTCMRTD